MEIANNKMEQEITQKQGDIFTLSNNTEFIESKSIQLSLTEPTDSDIHYMSIPDTAFVMR